jgi:hypothetical protein
MELNSGQTFEYRLRPRFERLFEPFDIRDDFSIPAGDYNFLGHEFTYQSATNKPWFYEVEYQKGSFYSGHSDELSTFLMWRKSSQLNASVELEQYWVRLKEGSFSTRLAMFRLDYSFTPLIGLSNYVQYDTDSGNIGLQSRLRWIVRPGNELFFVVNHSWQENPLDRWEALRTDVRAKLNYTFRF